MDLRARELHPVWTLGSSPITLHLPFNLSISTTLAASGSPLALLWAQDSIIAFVTLSFVCVRVSERDSLMLLERLEPPRREGPIYFFGHCISHTQLSTWQVTDVQQDLLNE